MSPGGHRKGAGRPRTKRAPAVSSAELESDVMTLQVAEHLDCSYATVLLLVREGRPLDISVRRRWRWLAGPALRSGEVDRGETGAAGRKWAAQGS